MGLLDRLPLHFLLAYKTYVQRTCHKANSFWQTVFFHVFIQPMFHAYAGIPEIVSNSRR